MTDQAAIARNNAVHMEAKKDGLSQRQDGSWILRVKIHPNDMPSSLMTAPMGTRFMIAVVEIGENEEPVQQEERASQTTTREVPGSVAENAPSRRKLEWDKMSGGQQAGLLCSKPAFWKFLGKSSADEAAYYVRLHCGVNSRSEIVAGTPAGDAWNGLVNEYRVWDRYPELG